MRAIPTNMTSLEEVSWQLPVAVSRSTRSCFVALPSQVARAARSVGSRSPSDANSSGSGTGAVVCLKLEWDATINHETIGPGNQIITSGSIGFSGGSSRSSSVNQTKGVAFVGWNGMQSGQGTSADYLISGISSSMSSSASRSSAACGDALEMSAALAESLGLPGTTRGSGGSGGQRVVMVRCTVLRHSAVWRAKRVEVAPASVDDWEVRL